MAGQIREPSADLVVVAEQPPPVVPGSTTGETRDVSVPSPTETAAAMSKLMGAPSEFSFFQLVLLLDRHFLDRPPVGSAHDAANETARFRAWASLGFPAADIVSFDWQTGSGRADRADRVRLEAVVAFLGLYGPSSPLAPHYTELVLGGDDAADTLRDFLDLFNHRLIALAYRSWKKYRYYTLFRGKAEDSISRSLFALVGRQSQTSYGNGGAASGAPKGGELLDWTRLLRFTGVLGLNCRSPEILGQVIADYFGVPARIEEAIERIVLIPVPQQSRLGDRRSTVASDWVIGDMLRDVSGKFRVWLGPLDWQEFQSFLPGGANHQALYVLIRYLSRDALDFDVWALPAASQSPELSLDENAAVPLGWATWLGGEDVVHQGVPLPPAVLPA